MQTVAFLSRHEAAKEMLIQLEEILGEFTLMQYKGNFSNFAGTTDGTAGTITFTDSICGECVIPGDSIVIAVMPIQLQLQVLNAIKFANSKGKLLQPLMNRVDKSGSISWEYCGLNWIKTVTIVTTLFSGDMPLSSASKRMY